LASSINGRKNLDELDEHIKQNQGWAYPFAFSMGPPAITNEHDLYALADNALLQALTRYPGVVQERKKLMSLFRIIFRRRMTDFLRSPGSRMVHVPRTGRAENWRVFIDWIDRTDSYGDSYYHETLSMHPDPTTTEVQTREAGREYSSFIGRICQKIGGPRRAQQAHTVFLLCFDSEFQDSIDRRRLTQVLSSEPRVIKYYGKRLQERLNEILSGERLIDLEIGALMGVSGSRVSEIVASVVRHVRSDPELLEYARDLLRVSMQSDMSNEAFKMNHKKNIVDSESE
jgi:hypothetical protein